MEYAAPMIGTGMGVASHIEDYSMAEVAARLRLDPQIDVGTKRMFSLLETLVWIRRSPINGTWTATSKAVAEGFVVERPYGERHGTQTRRAYSRMQVRVTLDGLHELHRLLTRLTESRTDR